MSLDNFNDNIKQKADAHAAAVPPDAWDNITKKKKRRLVPFFWWSLSSLLIVAGVFLYFKESKTKSNELLVSNQHTQLNESVSTKTNSITNSKGLSKNNVVDSATEMKDNLVMNDTKQIDKKEGKAILNLNNLTTDSTGQNNVKSFTSLHVAKGKMRMKITNGIASSDNADTNNPSKQKYTTGKKIRFKTSSVGPSSDSEATNEEANNAAAENIPGLNNKITNNRTNLINVDASTKADSELIASIKTKPPIDSSSGAVKKDIALNNRKDTTQKKINAGKSIKSPSLILDFSVTPFSPIQKYDVPQYIRRTSIDNGGNNVYTTNTVKTSLQFSAAFAFGMRKSIGKRFMIGTGLQYAQISENVILSGTDSNITYTAVQRLMVNSTGPYLVNDTISSVTTGTRVITATNSYKLYSIPVFMQYSFINHPSFSVAVTMGSYFTFAQYNNSITGKLESVYAYSPLPANEKNNLAIDLFGGIRATKTLYKNLSLFTEPNFRYNVSGYKLKSTFLNKNINQAGITFGLSYKIK